jgi:hypothetical protein
MGGGFKGKGTGRVGGNTANVPKPPKNIGGNTLGSAGKKMPQSGNTFPGMK